MTLLTVAQVAARLTLSPKTVYAMLQRGELPVVRLGSRIAVPADAVDRFIAARTVRPTPMVML